MKSEITGVSASTREASEDLDHLIEVELNKSDQSDQPECTATNSVAHNGSKRLGKNASSAKAWKTPRKMSSKGGPRAQNRSDASTTKVDHPAVCNTKDPPPYGSDGNPPIGTEPSVAVPGGGDGGGEGPTPIRPRRKSVNLREESQSFVQGELTTEVPQMELEAGTSTVVQLFTAEATPVDVHILRGYRRCPATGCMACMAGMKSQILYCLPLWNHLEQRVEILRFTKAKSARSLFGKVTGILRAPDFDDRLFEISRGFEGGYTLTELDASTLPGAGGESSSHLRAIKRYLKLLEAGEIDPGSIVPEVDLEELEERFPNLDDRIAFFTRSKAKRDGDEEG